MQVIVNLFFGQRVLRKLNEVLEILNYVK